MIQGLRWSKIDTVVAYVSDGGCLYMYEIMWVRTDRMLCADLIDGREVDTDSIGDSK